MKVLYACGATLAGGGFGTTAYHGARALERHGMLQRVLCSAARPAEIPAARIKTFGLVDRALRKLATYDRSNWLAHLHTVLFDRWAAHQLEPADALLAWYKCGLTSMRRARAMGMVNIGQWGSVHPRYQYESMAQECARWGVTRRMPRAVLERALAEIAQADWLICASPYARDSFCRLGVAEQKLIAIENGVDAVHFRPAPAAPPRPFRAVFVGQVGFRKGVPYLLQAWQQLGWRDAELWLAGSIDAEIRPLLARFKDLPGVRFLGHVADPLTVYQSADVSVFPSLQEGSAKVTFEALACGLPLVTTAESGAVVRDGVEGVLVPPRDAAAVAAGLDRLRGDVRWRRELGAAARARAEAYSWTRHGESLVGALRRVVEQGAPEAVSA